MKRPFFSSIVSILLILMMLSSTMLLAQSISKTGGASSRDEIDPSLSIEIGLAGAGPSSGHYPTGSYNISVDVSNDGNIDFSVVQVTCEVFREKDFLAPFTGFPMDMNLTELMAGDTMVAKFSWTVSSQGNYTINITATSTSASAKRSSTFSIMNITDIGIESWYATAPLMEPLNYYPTHTNIVLKVMVENSGNMDIQSCSLAVKITFSTTTEYEDTTPKTFTGGLSPGNGDTITIDTQWSSSDAKSFIINFTLVLENDMHMKNNYLEGNIKTGNKTNIAIVGVSDGVTILEDGGTYGEKSYSLRVSLENIGNVRYNVSFWLNLSIWKDNVLSGYNTVGYNLHYFSTDDLDAPNSLGDPGNTDTIFFSSWSPQAGDYVIKISINTSDEYLSDNNKEVNVRIQDITDLNVTITQPLNGSSQSTKTNLFVNVTVGNAGNQVVSTALVQLEVKDLATNTTVVGPNPLTFTNIAPKDSKFKATLLSSWNPTEGDFRITATIDLATDENDTNDQDMVDINFYTPLQVGSISGLVTNVFGEPIPDALVSLGMTRAFELSTHSDETGAYTLDGVPVLTEGLYNVSAVKSGQYHMAYNDTVTVKPNLVTDLNFILESLPLPVLFPLDGSRDVEVFETVDVTFDMEMDVMTIDSNTFYLENPDGVVDGILNFSSESAGVFNRTTVIFQPDSDLSFNTTYTLTISKEVSDKDGNHPLWMDFRGTFTTVDRFLENPQVFPLDGAQEVPLDVTVTATFTSLIDPLTIDTTTFLLRMTGDVALVGAIVTYDDVTRVASLTPNDPLETGTEYTVTLTTGIKDDLGASMLNDFTWKFKTVSQIHPEVSSIIPADGATNVLITTTIKVTFTKPMDQVPTEAAFSLAPVGGAVVAGTYNWTEDSRNMIFYPDEDLEYNTTYNVIIAITASDTESLKLEMAHETSFTTALKPADTTTGGDGEEDEVDPWVILLLVIIIIFIILVIVLIMVRRPAETEYEEEEPVRHYEEYEGEEFGDFECPECGTLVSGDMATCPGCGSEFEEAVFSCPECGTRVDQDTLQCPQCEYTFGPAEGEEGEEIGVDDEVEEYEDYEVIDEEGEEGVIIPGETELRERDIQAESIDEDDLSLDDAELD